MTVNRKRVGLISRLSLSGTAQQLLRAPFLLLAILMLTLGGGAADAQVFAVASISPVDGNIGTVTSDASGITTYRISSAAGTTTRYSGQGLPATATGTRALVTISCTGGGNTCGNPGTMVTATVKIDAIGTPTNRAQSLTNFNVAAGTVTPSATQGSGASLTFTIAGNFKSNQTFYLGADLPLTNAGTSGLSTAQYQITVSGNGNPSGSTASGSFSATVRRPLTLVKTSDLVFGNISRPTSGSNVITIDKDSGARSSSGGGNVSLLSGATSRAAYTVGGEVGQTFSISAPATLVMNRTGGGGSITANLVPSGATGSLAGTAGNAGAATIGVGGNFTVTSTTAPGAYSGTFMVTVDYN